MQCPHIWVFGKIAHVLGRDDRAFIVFIDFVAAFDSVSHKLLDAAMKAAGASDKCRAVFRAIYAKASAKVRVWSENGEETVSWASGIGRRWFGLQFWPKIIRNY